MTQFATDLRPQGHRAHVDRDLIPRRMVYAMFTLVAAVLALVTVARLTDQPLIALPPEGAVVAERRIVLTGELSGAAQVHAPDGTLIASLPSEKGGFVSGIYRVLQHERNKHGVAPDAPVLLLQKDTGRLELHDPATGWRADLMGFGADNARTFARILVQ